jgi:hypothetical protein
LGTTRFLFGLGILYYFEIGLIQFSISEGNYLIIGYLLLSLAMAIYFVAFNLKQKTLHFSTPKIDHEKHFTIKSYIALSVIYLLIILGHENIAWYINLLIPFLLLNLFP